MQIRLYNTLSAKQDVFRPLDNNRVTMYVCGPTVYDYVHIGNARPLVVFDTLYRFLKKHYKKVLYSRNLTDIDDKIIAASQAAKVPASDIAEKYGRAFSEDSGKLGLLPATVEPKATEHVPQMIAMIERLLANGSAYEAEGHVLFDVSSWRHYGCLSGRQTGQLRSGARVEVASYKRAPTDFVLWKPSTLEHPGWDSPWGRGRPGWHIECSAMAAAHLGQTIDIHGGGHDLVFPHHENEIAQSCRAHGTDVFARYWLHNGHVTVENEKMAKSLGNFVTLREVLSRHHGETIRYALLNTHYRKPLDWSKQALAHAKAALDRLYRAFSDHDFADFQNLGNIDKLDGAVVPEALGEDLNTPQALAGLHALANSGDAFSLLSAASCLGLLQQSPQTWFRWGSEHAFKIADQKVDEWITRRKAAREAGDFTRADEIRAQLHEAGITLEDLHTETVWRRWH